MQPPPPRPDAAERTERHLGALAELAGDALQLARDAARKALARSAAEAAAEAAGLPPPSFARTPGHDAVWDFCRMSREVCRIITLEAKVAGQWADVDRDRRRARRIEPLRARVRGILHEAVVVEPDGPGRETLLQTIEEALADDAVEELLAEGALLGDVVVEVCRTWFLRLDESRLPEDALHTTRMLPYTCRASHRASALAEHGPDPP